MDANGPVRLRPTDAAGVETRIEQAKNGVRRRAYELYCIRNGRSGSALEDWIAAEREMAAAPLACVMEEKNEVRVTACVPDIEECDVTVDVLPDEIVVEDECHGEARRYTRILLPARIDVGAAVAQLRGNTLEVMAPKAARAQGCGQAAE